MLHTFSHKVKVKVKVKDEYKYYADGEELQETTIFDDLGTIITDTMDNAPHYQKIRNKIRKIGNFGSYASLVRLQQFWNHPGNAHAQLEVLVWRRRRCLGACFELFRSFWKRLGCVWG